MRLLPPRAGRGEADVEGGAPFPFPKETGPDDDGSGGAILLKCQPWRCVLVFRKFQRKGSEKETEGMIS